MLRLDSGFCWRILGVQILVILHVYLTFRALSQYGNSNKLSQQRYISFPPLDSGRIVLFFSLSRPSVQ